LGQGFSSAFISFGMLGDLAQYCQDSSFARLSNRFVSRFGAGGESTRQIVDIYSFAVTDIFGNPFKVLREYNPGISLGAPKRIYGYRTGDIAKRIGSSLIGPNSRGSKSLHHVGAGVSIGNRVDIDSINMFAMAIQPERTGYDSLTQPLAIKITQKLLLCLLFFFFNNPQFNTGGNIGCQFDFDCVNAQRFQRLIEMDLTLVDLDPLLLD
jgi:hypothetical protein